MWRSVVRVAFRDQLWDMHPPAHTLIYSVSAHFLEEVVWSRICTYEKQKALLQKCLTTQQQQQQQQALC